MRIPVPLKIAVLTVAATGFYTYVGQLVPQKEVQPPEVVEISADLTSDDLAAIGAKIAEGKGLCLTCHTVGQNRPGARFPDLENLAVTAGSRVPGMGPLEYLAQSLYEPNVFIVEGFSGGMPEISKPPIGLSDDEIRAVIAYLQTLGGAATVTMETPIPFSASGPTAVASDSAAELDPASGPEGRLAALGCAECHGLADAAGSASSLADVGARRSRDQIFGALAAHPAVDGADPMTGVYEQLTLAETQRLADFLAGRTGS